MVRRPEKLVLLVVTSMPTKQDRRTLLVAVIEMTEIIIARRVVGFPSAVLGSDDASQSSLPSLLLIPSLLLHPVQVRFGCLCRHAATHISKYIHQRLPHALWHIA